MKCFLIIIIILQIISRINTSTSSLASHDVVAQQQDSDNFEAKQGGGVEAYRSRMVGRVGSRPPNCQRKCGGCTPCVATQMPATTDELGIQYTNYEPEGWKCKCGSTFFNP
ncbi:EPIDERMAL PATTERNING FACTOR-like protein 2 [Hibiscus syriacus]|uniref:EPIDERMAL PATTERNING FACTOR-like protein 2 n=1 Tax=Hibiscus syriacus TaxID=106335 RepID=UPI0019219309|nr:EPIDERMAL PATTERNING FACTOR-like protein 2 [Hibiscus syriacus]